MNILIFNHAGEEYLYSCITAWLVFPEIIISACTENRRQITLITTGCQCPYAFTS